MHALVLSAGWATRLGALAQGRPKHLLPIGDRSSLDIVVERLHAVPSLGRVHVITHDVFYPDFVAWRDARDDAPAIEIISDGTATLDDRLGSIGDIVFYLDTVRPDGDLLIVAGDNVFDFDIAPLAERARRDPVIGLYDVGSLELASRYGVVELDDGYLSGFVEKPEHPRSTLISTGVYGFPHARLSDVREYLEGGGSPDRLGSFIEWLYTRRRVAGIVFDGRWFDVGSPDEYERVKAAFGSSTRV